MSEVTKPILLDETGQSIVSKLDDIKDAITNKLPAGDPVKIIVVTPPTTTSYTVGDTLDLTGISVCAVFSNNALIDITDQCEFSPADGATLTKSNTKVDISWVWHPTSQEFTTSTPITVAVKIVTWAAGTDAEIANMIEAHYADEIDISDYWSVGDTRLIHLNSMQAPNPNSSETLPAQDITVVIVAIDHNNLAEAINGHTKAAITVQTREVLHEHPKNTETTGINGIYVNGTSSVDTTFNKWSDLYMRTYLNSIVLGAIPSGNFKAAIKQSKHYRHTTYNGSTSEEVTDYIFLPSYPEIYGTAASSEYTPTNPVEGTQFDYYITTANRYKHGNNNGVPEDPDWGVFWWNGSSGSKEYGDYGYTWGYVGSTGGDCDRGDYAHGLAPAWTM